MYFLNCIQISHENSGEDFTESCNRNENEMKLPKACSFLFYLSKYFLQVYPAGHAWIHYALYQLTDSGWKISSSFSSTLPLSSSTQADNDRPPLRSDTGFAQHLAMAAYLFNLFLVFRILLRTEMVIHILYTHKGCSSPKKNKHRKVNLGLG